MLGDCVNVAVLATRVMGRLWNGTPWFHLPRRYTLYLSLDVIFVYCDALELKNLIYTTEDGLWGVMHLFLLIRLLLFIGAFYLNKVFYSFFWWDFFSFDRFIIFFFLIGGLNRRILLAIVMRLSLPFLMVILNHIFMNICLVTAWASFEFWSVCIECFFYVISISQCKTIVTA